MNLVMNLMARRRDVNTSGGLRTNAVRGMSLEPSPILEPEGAAPGHAPSCPRRQRGEPPLNPAFGLCRAAGGAGQGCRLHRNKRFDDAHVD